MDNKDQTGKKDQPIYAATVILCGEEFLQGLPLQITESYSKGTRYTIGNKESPDLIVDIFTNESMSEDQTQMAKGLENGVFNYAKKNNLELKVDLTLESPNSSKFKQILETSEKAGIVPTETTIPKNKLVYKNMFSQVFEEKGIEIKYK